MNFTERLPRNISEVGLVHVSLSSSKILWDPQHNLDKTRDDSKCSNTAAQVPETSGTAEDSWVNVRGLGTPS